MIEYFVVYCFNLFICCQFLISSCREEIKMHTMDVPMDAEHDIPISCEEIVKTKKRIKNPNPKWYKHFLSCLDEKRHKHMLRYVPYSNESEFIVIFTDRKNKGKWRPSDISLFKELDDYIGNVHNKQRSKDKIEEDVKVRFKSNMCKCIKQRYIEMTGEQKIEKYKIVKKYKILWRPPVSVGESSNGGRIGGNKGKSIAKAYKKNNKTNLKRRNFQEKTTNPESIPQVGNYQIMNSESIPQMGNNEIMNFETIPQMGNHQIINFETIPQMGNHQVINFETIPQMGNHQIINFEIIPQMANHQIINFESMSKEGNGKDEIVESNHLVEALANFQLVNLPQERESKIENIRQEDKHNVAIPQHVLEKKYENDSHYLWLSGDSEIKTDENEHANYGVSLEILKTSYPELDFSLENDIKTDENEHVNSGGNVEILKTSYPEWDFSLENDDGFENQGNQYIYNGKYILEEDEYTKECECTNLKCDPLMCSGQFEIDFSPLGTPDDWSCSYQPLRNMETN